MSGEHSYASGVEKMLFVLSRGFCYAPTCKNPVVRFEAGGEPEVAVFIAHIRAARRNGPRWVEEMDPEDRKSFENLILLCKKHHVMVDSKKNEKKYPVETLLEWKRLREKQLGSQIKGLSFLTEDDLISVLEKVATGSRNQMMDAIERVHGLSREMKDMLKSIIDEPYRRALVDPDAVTSLEHSAGMLAFLQDHTPVLAHSAQAISSLADHGSVLVKFADAVKGMPDLTLAMVANLEYAAADLAEKTEQLRGTSEVVGESTGKLVAAASILADKSTSQEPPYWNGQSVQADEADYTDAPIAEAELRHLDDAVSVEPGSDGRVTKRKLFFRGMAAGAALILLIQLAGILFFK
ncbi:hypothetical protein O7600_13340 [Micromonospora sp. WMMA1998]|uniref:hypothetical protein n=1 Tax=Micromonospora sp. WMMA1998 TaxID=3015167 RepID=UPI00248AF9C6|nr:hypothetical protein [Micromonospora sp. WMMA1998]WBC17742.1 hypothetical protein O7600_13340 [Micromonospora sp. WMMA1998]